MQQETVWSSSPLAPFAVTSRRGKPPISLGFACAPEEPGGFPQPAKPGYFCQKSNSSPEKCCDSSAFSPFSVIEARTVRAECGSCPLAICSSAASETREADGYRYSISLHGRLGTQAEARIAEEKMDWLSICRTRTLHAPVLGYQGVPGSSLALHHLQRSYLEHAEYDGEYHRATSLGPDETTLAEPPPRHEQAMVLEAFHWPGAPQTCKRRAGVRSVRRARGQVVDCVEACTDTTQHWRAIHGRPRPRGVRGERKPRSAKLQGFTLARWVVGEGRRLQSAAQTQRPRPLHWNPAHHR